MVLEADTLKKDYYNEEEIKKALEKPFDYGSDEYLEVIKKIKANRDKYKAEQEVKQILKYKFIKGIYSK